MRIAVLTSLYPSPPRPNEGVFAERRWLGMAERGHEVRVVQPLPRTPPLAATLARGAWRDIARCPEREVRGGIEVVRPRYLHVPKAPRSNAERFARAGVRALLSGTAPDCAIADYAWPAARAQRALASAGIPFVIHGRGSDVLQVAGEAGLAHELADALRGAGHWCAVSNDLVQRMDELGGAQCGVLVPNGVDMQRFRPRDRAEARAEIGQPADGRLVCVVGHLIPRKDPLLALAAFEAAKIDDARLVFVGRGPLEEELRRAVAASPARERVELVGERRPDELASWYAASDALLLTSWREGRPNVVLEALASGRPAVATRAGGTAELFEGLGDLLCDERDPQLIGERLRAAVTDPPEPEHLRARIAAFSWEAGLERLEEVLERARAAAGAGSSA